MELIKTARHGKGNQAIGTRPITSEVKTMLRKVEENPRILETIPMSECLTLLADSWFHPSPCPMMEIYRYIYTHGSVEDIQTAHEAVYDCLAKGDATEVFPGCSFEELVESFRKIVTEIAEARKEG